MVKYLLNCPGNNLEGRPFLMSCYGPMSVAFSILPFSKWIAVSILSLLLLCISRNMVGYRPFIFLVHVSLDHRDSDKEGCSSLRNWDFAVSEGMSATLSSVSPGGDVFQHVRKGMKWVFDY